VRPPPPCDWQTGFGLAHSTPAQIECRRGVGQDNFFGAEGLKRKRPEFLERSFFFLFFSLCTQAAAAAAAAAVVEAPARGKRREYYFMMKSTEDALRLPGFFCFLKLF
jgi:hypothetical protein